MLNSKEVIIIFLLVSCIGFISAIPFGYDYLEHEPTGNGNYSNYSNFSEYTNYSNFTDCWITAEGIKCDVADITYDEISGGDVNALGYTGYFNFIQGAVGMLSIDGDPWYLGGTSLELGENLTVDGNSYLSDTFPRTTLTYSLGSGALRWLKLWVQDINAENIDAYNMTLSNNLTVGGVANFTGEMIVNGVNLTNVTGNFLSIDGTNANQDLFINDNSIAIQGSDNDGEGFTCTKVGTGNLQVCGYTVNSSFVSGYLATYGPTYDGGFGLTEWANDTFIGNYNPDAAFQDGSDLKITSFGSSQQQFYGVTGTGLRDSYEFKINDTGVYVINSHDFWAGNDLFVENDLIVGNDFTLEQDLIIKGLLNSTNQSIFGNGTDYVIINATGYTTSSSQGENIFLSNDPDRTSYIVGNGAGQADFIIGRATTSSTADFVVNQTEADPVFFFTRGTGNYFSMNQNGDLEASGDLDVLGDVNAKEVNGANQTMFDYLIANYLDWITVSVEVLTNFYNKTDADNRFLQNGTYLNATVLEVGGVPIKNWSELNQSGSIWEDDSTYLKPIDSVSQSINVSNINVENNISINGKRVMSVDSDGVLNYYGYN